MAFVGQDVLADLNNLISEITGFHESDENFATCQQYCLSHVVHHMYPSINRRQIQKDVKDYESRFFTHGYFDVAHEFHSQVDNFLNAEDLFAKNPQFDIQWNLLNLLFEMSTNLTAINKVPTLLATDEDEEEDEDCNGSGLSDINWSEYLKHDVVSSFPDEYSDLSSWQDSDEDEEEIFVPVDSLAKSKVTPGQIIIAEAPCKQEIANAMARTAAVETLLQSHNRDRFIQEDMVMWGSWMLMYNCWLNKQGVNSSPKLLPELEIMENVLYYLETGRDITISDAALTSVTQFAVEDYLSDTRLYAEIMKEMTSFIQQVGLNSLSTSPDTTSCVLKAYSLALDRALQPYRDKLMELHRTRNGSSLLSINRELRPMWAVLTSLYTCHKQAVIGWEAAPNWEISLRILCVLFTALQTATTAHHIYLAMFLSCLQVYLDIMHRWLICMKLIDHRQDFIITGTECQNLTDCDIIVLPYHKVINQLNLNANPVFVEIIANKMWRAGHSLTVLGKLPTVHGLSCKSANPTFYEDLSRRLLAELRFPELQQGAPRSSMDPGAVDCETSADDVLCHIPDTWDHRMEWSGPVYKIVELGFASLLSDRLDFLNSDVRAALRDLQLQQRLSLLRSVLLCNDIVLIQPFIDHMTAVPACREDAYSLTLHLRECLESRFPSLVDDVSMTVDTTAEPTNILEAIDGLKFVLKVDWPLNLVLTDSCMAQYNDIWRLVLKLKWALTSLSNMGLKGSDAPPLRHETLSRLRYLRFWSLNLLSQISNYYRTHVFTKLDLDLDGQKDVFIKDIVAAHAEFIANVHRRCLLDEEGVATRAAIFQELVPLCVDLEYHWSHGQLQHNKLDMLTEIFFNCQQQISQFIASQ